MAIHSLADLISPVSMDAFLAHVTAGTRLHIQAADRARADGLLSWRDVNDLLSSDVFPPDRLKVFRGGVLVPEMFYRADKRKLRAGALQDLLARGASLRLEHMDALIAPIRVLAHQIERRLACQVSANAYLTFGKGGALKRHWDPHDNIIVQIAGAKTWRFYGQAVEHPLTFDAARLGALDAPFFEAELSPGDVLFSPRGDVHEASVEEGNSIHLTFGLVHARGVDFAARIAALCADDALFRRDIPRLGGREALAAHEASLKARLHDLIDSTSFLDFLSAHDSARLPAPSTALGDQPIAARSRLSPAPRRRIALPATEPGGAPVRIVIGNEAHSLRPAAIEALAWLFEHEREPVEALAAALAPRHGQAAVDAGLRELSRRGLLIVHGAGEF